MDTSRPTHRLSWHFWGDTGFTCISSHLGFQLINYCYIFTFTYGCLCVHVYVCPCIHTCKYHGACSSERKTCWSSVLSVYYVGSGNWTQSLRLSGGWFYLSLLTSLDKLLSFYVSPLEKRWINILWLIFILFQKRPLLKRMFIAYSGEKQTYPCILDDKHCTQ